MIILLICVDLILLRRTIVYKNEIALKNTIIDSIALSTHKLDYLRNNLYWNLEYEKSAAQTQLLTDTTGNELPISKVVRKPTLVFRYSDRNCHDCIRFGIAKLNELTDTAKIEAVILSQYDEVHSLKTKGRIFNPGNLPMYDIARITPIDDLNVPYFFILNEDSTIGELFVPEKLFPSLTERYLKTIGRKYFNFTN